MSRSPSRLGRGMAGLMGEDDPGNGHDGALHDIQTDLIDPNPHQPRGAIDPASLTELVASIQAQGVLQPILVRRSESDGDRYVIVAGERRWRATIIADRPTIPCHVRAMSDEQASAAALVENLQRADLTALEEADGYRRLMTEFGLTQQRLGHAVGKSRSHIANSVRLLDLPEAVRAHLRSGALTAGHARALLAHADPEQAANVVLRRGLNVRQTEALVDRAQQPAAPGQRTTLSIDTDAASVESDLTERLGLKVVLKTQGQRGSLTLHYTSLDQLDHVLARLGRA